MSETKAIPQFARLETVEKAIAITTLEMQNTSCKDTYIGAVRRVRQLRLIADALRAKDADET